MPYVLSVIILVDVGALAYTIGDGLGLATIEATRHHMLAGVLTTILLVFTHSLVLFYLIGTGIDIREAVGVDEELSRRYVPLTRRLKRQVFPIACLAALLASVAALFGAEVHSRLIVAAGAVDAPLPLRGVSVWWLHLAIVIGAVVTNLWAFVCELRATWSNRAAIAAINRCFEAAGASPDAVAR